MDISDNLDSESVDVAGMTAAINSPCICQPLHRNCNPSTCDRAPSNSIVETDHVARKSIEGASSKDDFIQVICHRGELRHAALHGCVTCAILYAGIAGLNNAPVVGDDSWPSKTRDRWVNVRITPRGELLRCELSYAKEVTKNDRQPIKLVFYASENSEYRTSCQVFSPLSSLSDSTNSSTSFEQVATWLDECQSHSHCSISSPTLLPTRVIDVGDRNNPETRQPFLFEPGELVAPYIALSHCWGKNPIVRTTTGTLAQRKQGIEMSLLPSDFRDAIVIARRLDVRYLWIDSLCIIQDDQLDWQTESAKMCTIYQDALLTISAGLSGHGGGCFCKTPWLGHQKSVEITPIWAQEFPNEQTVDSIESQDILSEATSSIERSARTVHEDNGAENEHLKHCFALYCPSINLVDFYIMRTKKYRKLCVDGGRTAFFSIPHTTSGIFVRERRALQHYQFSSDFLIPLPSNHIARRAWVFQERLLSTRVLNFTRSEIVWECKTVIDCQCKRMKLYEKYYQEDVADDPENESDVPLQLAELSTQTLKLFFEDQISVEDLSSKGLVLLWVNIIIHYSALQLSHPKDRLPALSGLAKRFQLKEILGDYVAGLWTEHFDRLLCWDIVQTRGPRNRSAGYIAPTWSWASVSDVFYPKFWRVHEGAIIESSIIIGSVIKVSVFLDGADPTGAVSEGVLELASLVVESKLLIRPFERVSRVQRTETELTSASSSDSESESESESIVSEPSPDRPFETHPYRYQILHEETGSQLDFHPDSISELDVLMKEHTVTLLLWAVRSGPWKSGDTKAFSCFVLLPVPENEGVYTRLGLLHYYESSEEEPIPAKKWFGDSSVRTVTII